MTYFLTKTVIQAISLLLAVLLLAGCSGVYSEVTDTAPAESQTEPPQSSAEPETSADEPGKTDEVSSESEQTVKTDPEPGTSDAPGQTEPLPETTEEETTAQPPEDTPYVFNNHVWSCFLDDCYPAEYRESFFALCDALREGADSFPCASREIYDFCMDEVTHNQLYPVACTQITGKSPDGSVPFENGVGRIYYKKSKTDFLERQRVFIQNIEAIMEAWIRPDYSEFEKCLSLYEYFACYYSYDYEGNLDRSKDGSGCATLKYRIGVCADFSALYAYLLMQSGVDAIAVSNWGESDWTGYHAWTFVDIGGKGYHIDPTWGLKEDKSVEVFTLDYFMMTDADRAAYGYPYELLEAFLLPGRYAKDCVGYVFSATDDSYRLPDFSYCSRYFPERNVLFYRNATIGPGEFEFIYE